MTSSREYWHLAQAVEGAQDAIATQAARIAELEAELAALRPWAEVGKRMQWTRVTDDPATWPPDCETMLILTQRADMSGDYDWVYVCVTASECREEIEDGICVNRWQPITVPAEAADA